jgi:hypothetical protein
MSTCRTVRHEHRGQLVRDWHHRAAPLRPALVHPCWLAPGGAIALVARGPGWARRSAPRTDRGRTRPHQGDCRGGHGCLVRVGAVRRDRAEVHRHPRAEAGNLALTVLAGAGSTSPISVWLAIGSGGVVLTWHGRWHRMGIAAIADWRQVSASVGQKHSLTCCFAAGVDIRGGIQILKTGEASSRLAGWAGHRPEGVSLRLSAGSELEAPRPRW